MTVFVDASVLVAIIAEEADAATLISRLDRDEDRRTSPIAIWEAAVGIARLFALPPSAAPSLLQRFLQETGIAVVPLDEGIAAIALEAFQRFGKGRHPAALNMGDCFAYACAKDLGCTLLSKGDDFAKTDLARTDLGSEP